MTELCFQNRNGYRIDALDISATRPLERGPTKGIQVYEEDRDSPGECWKSRPHKSAELHCTGEAQYIDDMPKYQGRLNQ